MIIFGTRSKLIASDVTDTICHHCQSRDTAWLYLYRHYFHIFWIPAFPLWKSAFSECAHCKMARRVKEFDDELLRAYKQIKETAKTPWWMYFWLLLVVVLILSVAAIGIIKGS